MNIKNKILLVILTFFIGISCFSQTDTLALKKIHSPKRAAIYSAVLPGLGQAYNKKYLKIPIVYVGLGVLTYFIIDNHSEFNKFKQEYIYRHENDGNRNNFPMLENQALLNEMDRWGRYRDLCLAGAAVFYILQIVDANVDAHLFDFDIGDNLTVKIHPKQFNNNLSASPVMGVGCTIRFR